MQALWRRSKCSVEPNTAILAQICIARTKNRATLAQCKRHSLSGNPTVLRLRRCRGMRHIEAKEIALTGCVSTQQLLSHDIRFVAVNDNVDSNKGENELAPVKNLFNEWFIRDTSLKIRASHRIKGKSGEPLSKPPYGYMKDPENKKHWLIDEEAAEVVRNIYKMYLDGRGTEQIAGYLEQQMILTPNAYAKEKGSTNALHEKWKEKVLSFVTSDGVLSAKKFKEMCRDIINDFDNLPITDEKKPRVGIVGEILVKFLPAANNHLSELLEAEGAEAVVPDLTDFLLYCFYNENFKNENLGTPKKSKIMSNAIIAFFEHLRGAARKAFNESKRFSAPARIDEVAELARPIVSIGNQTGEGWFLTGEMMELIETGAKNIVCIQPFGCLPNHVVGKGVLKKIRADHPDANLVAIDYDPGASEVNQLNRIKLMLSTAFKNL